MSQTLRIQNISKSFDGKKVLDNISFEVHPGEILTLLGPSGCGKTTLLNIISGIVEPDAGSVHLATTNITPIPPEKRSINTVFQNYALFPHMSVFNNVAFGLRVRRMPKDVIREEVYNALELVHLSDKAHHKPHELSGGQKQRVAMARAFINKPNILLLDEPLSALDAKLRSQMQTEIKHLQQQLGITFILVTHDQQEAMALSSRIVVMSEGRIEQIGTPKEVYETPQNLFTATFIGNANIFDATIISRTQGTGTGGTGTGDTGTGDTATDGTGTGDTTTGDTGTGDTATVLVENARGVIDISGKDGVSEMCKILLRPEDMRVFKREDVADDLGAYMLGTVTTKTYKGATVELDIELESGKTISVSEFFDEEHEDLDEDVGDKVAVNWISGWEVVYYPHEI